MLAEELLIRPFRASPIYFVWPPQDEATSSQFPLSVAIPILTLVAGISALATALWRRVFRSRFSETDMLFMVVERFNNRDPVPIYKRLKEAGRSMPTGLRYVDSWIEANFDSCFQLMECDDVNLLMQWILEWRDLVEFEVVPVSASKEVRKLFGGE